MNVGAADVACMYGHDLFMYSCSGVSCPDCTLHTAVNHAHDYGIERWNLTQTAMAYAT